MGPGSAGYAKTASPAASPGVQSPAVGDPYAHLSPAQLQAMNEELHDAEIKYGAKYQEAESIPDPEERRIKLEGMRNSFGTKQSLIRKKYGVRLRERRTKAEIQAEKERMGIGGKGPKRSHDTANQGQYSTPSKGPGRGPGGFVTINFPASPAGSAAAHESKRRRLDSNGGPSAPAGPAAMEPPPKRVAVAEMGGLGSSAATAALQDPTLPPDPSPSSAANYSARNASRSMGPRLPDKKTSPGNQAAGTSTPQTITIDGDTDSDDDNEDIPATLPGGSRHSLTPKTSVAV